MHTCTPGVGDGAVRNRYCAVAFGSFGTLRQGHFLLVNGERCFFAADFPQARVQLINAGLTEDGYEAMQFAIDNVPFRTSPFIAKNMILVTDEGRSVIPLGENITRTSIESELRNNNILLNVVVQADYQVLGDCGTVWGRSVQADYQVLGDHGTVWGRVCAGRLPGTG